MVSRLVAVDVLGGMPEAKATFRSHHIIMRMKRTPMIMG